MLEKLIRGSKVTRADIEDALFEMCDDNHGGDCGSCLVCQYNGGEVPDTASNFESNRGCDCFKNGKAMREFIVKKMKQKKGSVRQNE